MVGLPAQKFVPALDMSAQMPAPREPQGVLDLTADSALSPALQLQNRLVEQFSGLEATMLKTDKYDVRVRLAWIVGISCAGWGLIGLAATGVYALIA